MSDLGSNEDLEGNSVEYQIDEPKLDSNSESNSQKDKNN